MPTEMSVCDSLVLIAALQCNVNVTSMKLQSPQGNHFLSGLLLIYCPTSLV